MTDSSGTETLQDKIGITFKENWKIIYPSVQTIRVISVFKESQSIIAANMMAQLKLY